ncbi:hypothetical protein VNO77_42692 [Canavalia gladiata]|uniref:Uncharacterized protein n=1 Tax=Canavalia gladiata TaxID=3824 RepID=A0AAN9PPC2_CANGL
MSFPSIIDLLFKRNGTSFFKEKHGLPVETFSKVQEIFSYADWMNPREEMLHYVLKQKCASPSHTIYENLNTGSNQYVESGNLLQQKILQMAMEKMNEANCFLSSNLEKQFVSSANPSQGNNMSRNEDNIIKDDATLPWSNESDIISKKCLALMEELQMDTSSSGSISPQTPPLRPPLTTNAKEVHDLPPHRDSHPNHHLPLKPRHPLVEENKPQSQDRSHSFIFSSTTEIPVSSTSHNRSPNEYASHPPASAITSNQPPPIKKIFPVGRKHDSSPSQPQTPTPTP